MSDDKPSAQEWLSGFAAEIGLDAPSPKEIESLLNLAGIAAQRSARLDAPIASRMEGVPGIEHEEAVGLVQKYENGRDS